MLTILHNHALPTQLTFNCKHANSGTRGTCCCSQMIGDAGMLVESRGSSGDAIYTRVEQMIEAGANRAAGREAGGSLAPENDPPLASAQDLIRQVSLLCETDPRDNLNGTGRQVHLSRCSNLMDEHT